MSLAGWLKALALRARWQIRNLVSGQVWHERPGLSQSSIPMEKSGRPGLHPAKPGSIRVLANFDCNLNKNRYH